MEHEYLVAKIARPQSGPAFLLIERSAGKADMNFPVPTHDDLDMARILNSWPLRDGIIEDVVYEGMCPFVLELAILAKVVHDHLDIHQTTLWVCRDDPTHNAVYIPEPHPRRLVG
jgi:hypothetical protein